jgi:cellulose synthase/poly-beta-1,6-N-acetylglucosamine synthase-like glycosyltransferase
MDHFLGYSGCLFLVMTTAVTFMKKGLLQKPFVVFGTILDKIIFTHTVVLGLPTILYYTVLVNGGNLIGLHLIIPVLYVITSVVVMGEALATVSAYRSFLQYQPNRGILQALPSWSKRERRQERLQQRRRQAFEPPSGMMPKFSLIVAAYLPNEQDLIIETLTYILETMRRPGGMDLILAYNRPDRLPIIEAELEALAARHPELRLLNVEGSRSKAENVNAALAIVTGEITGILDADHRPNPDSFERAWRWLATGQYAAVQGRNVIRNYGLNLLTRLVGVEFECMYGVSHPAKSLLVDTGMFCGSNGYWRSSVLQRIRFSPTMMTEDIDATLRALLRGHNFIHDPGIITTELAPENIPAFWSQRKRWAQGWLEVALKHQVPLIKSAKLDRWQKVYWSMLLIYSALFHFIALQVFPIFISLTLSSLQAPEIPQTYVWMTTALTLASGPIQTMAAWGVRSRMTKQRFSDYLLYCICIPFYCIFKNVIAIIAIYDHVLGNNEWVVTSRGLRESMPVTAYAEVGEEGRSSVAVGDRVN